jgi:hypothetical protein
MNTGTHNIALTTIISCAASVLYFVVSNLLA